MNKIVFTVITVVNSNIDCRHVYKQILTVFTFGKTTTCTAITLTEQHRAQNHELNITPNNVFTLVMCTNRTLFTVPTFIHASIYGRHVCKQKLCAITSTNKQTNTRIAVTFTKYCCISHVYVEAMIREATFIYKH
jgi:hypothetical protein